MLASMLLWLWPRVCVLSLTGCQAMLASVLSMVVTMCVCAVVNWMSSYARFCASMVVATCVLSLTGCQAMLASVLLWLWHVCVCCR